MRPLGVVGVAAAAALTLGACGADPAATNSSQGSGAQSQANVACEGKSPLSAEGSTAQKNAMDVFVQRYAQRCQGKQVNYNPTGSGAGVKQFTAGLVDFGGSDSPLSSDKGETAAAQQRCAGAEAWNLPLVVGPVAVAYKLDGVDKLTLTPEVTAKIFSGGITKWNDPAIKSLKGNESLNLPDKPIQVVSRSDESGTTDNFQQYLAAAAKGAWTKGGGKSFKGGVGNGAQGSNGVTAAVRQGDGAITYVEASFVKEGLKAAQLDSGSGPVPLDNNSIGKALEAAKFKKEGSKDLALDLDKIYAGNTPGAYPLLLATYEIVCSKYPDAEVGKAVKAFLTVAATDGQAPLAERGYAPIPKALQDKVVASVGAIS